LAADYAKNRGEGMPVGGNCKGFRPAAAMISADFSRFSGHFCHKLFPIWRRAPMDKTAG